MLYGPEQALALNEILGWGSPLTCFECAGIPQTTLPLEECVQLFNDSEGALIVPGQLIICLVTIGKMPTSRNARVTPIGFCPYTKTLVKLRLKKILYLNPAEVAMRRVAPLDFMWEAKMAAVSFFRDPKVSVLVECTWMDRLREFLVLATPKTARGSAATFLVGRKTGLTALPSAGVPREAEQTPQDAEQEEGRSGGDVGPMEEEKGSVDGDGDGKQEGELTHKESHGMSDLSSSESDAKVCVCGVCV